MNTLIRSGYRAPLLIAAAAALAVATAGSSWILAVALLGTLALVLLLVPAVVVVLSSALGPRRSRLRRPGNSALLCTALLAAVGALAYSGPAPDGPLLLAAGSTGGLLVLGRAVWQVIPGTETAAPAGNWRWAVPPLLLVAAVGMVRLDLPERARFGLGRAALTDFARSDSTGPGWVGTYRIGDAVRTGTGVLLIVDGTGGVSGPAGYGYFPDGRLPEDYGTYTHLSGPWYRWVQDPV
ncbi:hypothetical protein ACIA8O_06170 [Kitasatospora sp. NPDC051853]|uniref:hypothetical protein n=1 Tax=Kitasatospora sp. NPDC051853 TaxID=3364058 RepID=UPI0037BA4EF9